MSEVTGIYMFKAKAALCQITSKKTKEIRNSHNKVKVIGKEHRRTVLSVIKSFTDSAAKQ